MQNTFSAVFKNVVINEENASLLDAFLNFLWIEKGLSDNTVNAYRSDLTKLALYLQKFKHTDFLGADEKAIQDYLALCVEHKLSERSSARALSAARAFYIHLVANNERKDNPVAHIRNPKLPKYLPSTLTEQQVEDLLATPNIDDPIQCRDKAMLELLYATGIRVSELVNLQMHELGMMQGVIRVFGKGQKERLVPMGEQALDCLQYYLKNHRSDLLKTPINYVFPSARGKLMTRQTFWHRIKLYAKQANIGVHLSPHTLRHAFATHLLNHGADLRVVQMLLGHSDLSTTQIYTHVASHRLQSLVEQHHPRG